MKQFSLLLVVLLAGCASTGVVQMEKDTYLIAKKSPQVGFGAPIGIKGEVYSEANAFCSKDGKTVETIKADETNSGFAKSAAFSLEFRCVSEHPEFSVNSGEAGQLDVLDETEKTLSLMSISGVDPLYILVSGFSQVCSEQFPENAQSYRTTLLKMIAKNPGAYAKMEAGPEFQEMLQHLLREAKKMPVEELRNVCPVHLQDREKPVTLGR